MKPWERQRDATGELEPQLWFSRFDRFYRPLGPERSMLAAYNAWRVAESNHEEKGGIPRSNSVSQGWDRNAKKWHWRERAEAWDEEERQKLLAAEEEARAEMIKRHLNIAKGLQGIGAKKLKELGDAESLSSVTPDQARLYLKDGIAIERTARGLPEHLVGITELSDAELVARYKSLIDRVGSFGAGDGEAGDPDAP